MWFPLRITRRRHYASLRNIIVQYLPCDPQINVRARVCIPRIGADVAHSWDYRWTTFQKRQPISGAFSAIDLVCASAAARRPHEKIIYRRVRKIYGRVRVRARPPHRRWSTIARPRTQSLCLH